MSLTFLKAGLESSIQDFGRFKQMHHGISQSGAMDQTSMQMANWLVSKPLHSPLIEITLMGPIIRFELDMSIAICGAEFNCSINGKNVANDETITIKSGDVLTFKKLKKGLRAYLAFTGELYLNNEKMLPVLGSYSTHMTAKFGGYHGRSFENNDRLEIVQVEIPEFKKFPPKFRLYFSGNYLLRCVPSIESCIYSHQQIQQFYSQAFTVTPASNRMGVRLGGLPIAFENNADIISSGLTQGSIQIPPSGQPIISSVDGQTIGGYPRIANVISADLSLLGQLKSGDKVRFSLIEKTLAKEAFIEKKKRLDILFNSQKDGD